MTKKKIFLICPVRYGKKLTRKHKKVQEKINEYVNQLEEAGHKVHWPPRDTNQNDPTGLRICTDNGLAISEADEVHIWWHWQEKKWWQKLMWWIREKKSTGSLFDFGMAFMLFLLNEKRIILANPEDIKPTKNKSFTNVLLDLQKIREK